jgi:hypothetical protein
MRNSWMCRLLLIKRKFEKKVLISFVNLKHSTMPTYLCVVCKVNVRPRQHALECDGVSDGNIVFATQVIFFVEQQTYQISKTDIQKSPMPSYNTLGPLQGKDSPHV